MANGRVELLTGPLAGWSAVSWAAVVAVAIGISACGGGGGSGSGGDSPSSGGNPPPAGPPPAGSGSAGTGTLYVKVTDAYGEAVGGAYVSVNGSNFAFGAQGDAAGLVRIADVPAGQVLVCASHVVRGSDRCGGQRPVTLGKDQVLELSRQLEVHRGYAAATVIDSRMVEGSLSADGRQLDVVLRIAVTAARPGVSWFDNRPGLVSVSDCEARSGAELGDLGPRCIHGIDGRDHPYSFERVNDLGVVRAIEGVPQSWAVGLLIDQGDAGLMPALPPNDPRLFAAKAFANGLLPGTSLALAGFASDEPSGSASRLPQRPVTFFPVESPAFVSNWPEAYGILQDLSGLVGGGSPLYAAIETGIEFMAAHAPAGRQRALVVLADGSDSTCGSPAQCAQQRRAIVRRARETGVQLFLAGVHDEQDCNDLPADEAYYCLLTIAAKAPLRDLAAEGGLPLAVGALPNSNSMGSVIAPLELALEWLSGSVRVQDVNLRLTSATAGAFAPGTVVTGNFVGVNPQMCPWDCYSFGLPFRVEIPR